ncbi:hypothetical protein JHK85_042963 [Glycine max]|nr:hypothetical protein JHK85_042963 [Glycine max]
MTFRYYVAPSKMNIYSKTLNQPNINVCDLARALDSLSCVYMLLCWLSLLVKLRESNTKTIRYKEQLKSKSFYDDKQPQTYSGRASRQRVQPWYFKLT